MKCARKWVWILLSQRHFQNVFHSYPVYLGSWISPWMKSISNELDITIHVIASQLSDHCDVISDRLWHHQKNGNRAGETRGRYVKIVVSSSFMDSLCHVRNKALYILLWRTVSVLTRVLVASQLGKYTKVTPLVSTETVRHSSTYIILRRCTSYMWVIKNYSLTKVRLILQVWRYLSCMGDFLDEMKYCDYMSNFM